jgi:hypothetical protein
VNAHFCAQVAVGVDPADGERGTIDAGFVARLIVDHVRAIAAALTPAQVHAHQHLSPVLGLGAARPGMNADDGASMIDGPRQHSLQLGLAHPPLELRGQALEFGQRALVVFGRGELEQLEPVAHVSREPLDQLELFLRLGTAAHVGLRAILVVPEIRRTR